MQGLEEGARILDVVHLVTISDRCICLELRRYPIDNERLCQGDLYRALQP